MKCNRNVLSDAVRVCLAIGAMGAVAAPAVAQDEATLDRIEVTGSRIKRAEVEGPSPVTVITRQDLDVIRCGAHFAGLAVGAFGFGEHVLDGAIEGEHCHVAPPYLSRYAMT